MPLKTKIQIISAIISGLFLVGMLSAYSLIGAVILFVAGLLVAEAYYPNWNFFSKAITRVSKNPPSVALTFDDGPSLSTLPILDILKNENVKATFFFLGENMLRHPDIVKRVREEGHAIGSHAFSHAKLHRRGPEFIFNEFQKTEDVFHQIGIKPDPLVRFPHGFKNIFAVREVSKRKLTVCAWGRGVWDSKKPGVDAIVNRALETKAGEILLLHDGDGAKQNPDRQQTVDALRPIILGLKQKGYIFVRLTEATPSSRFFC